CGQERGRCRACDPGPVGAASWWWRRQRRAKAVGYAAPPAESAPGGRGGGWGVRGCARGLRRRALAAVAGIGTAVSAAALSTGPWRMPGGYMGDSLWVQVPALVAVIAVGLAALPPITRRPRRDAGPPPE
ncbi:hypothetical protein, partial [Nocardia flavorosea]|uniref:hypothetical protein n=1 Tax=Nocardia flavorosea TaxID=53429 RepID=UPI00245820FF